MSDLPERIWADSGRKGKWVEGTWTDIYPGGGAVVYVRADLLATKDAEIARLTSERDAAVAAVLERAEKAVNDRGVREQEDFGLCRETQNFYRARDIIRALPRDGSALDAVVAARTAGLREALRDIADPKRLTSHGDPTVLRDHARAALAKLDGGA